MISRDMDMLHSIDVYVCQFVIKVLKFFLRHSYNTDKTVFGSSVWFMNPYSSVIYVQYPHSSIFNVPILECNFCAHILQGYLPDPGTIVSSYDYASSCVHATYNWSASQKQ